MSVTNKLSKFNKFISVLLGGIVFSLMLCVTYMSGFDNIWGLLGVGLVFTLLIFCFYGNRAKMKFELISIGTIIFSTSFLSYSSISTSTLGSIIFLALMAFSFFSLYGIFIGSLFSAKEYKIYHYFVLALIFFASAIISKATFSHILLRTVLPEIASDFKAGLEDKGIDLFWREAYLHNFDDMSFANSVSGGIDYYNYINIISYAFASFVLIIFAFLIFRDKITTLVSLFIDVISSALVTVLNLVFSYYPEYSNISISILVLGFAFGVAIMFVIAFVPNKYSAGKKYRSELYIQNRFVRLIVNFMLFEIAFVIVPVRALIYSLAQNAKEYSILTLASNYKSAIVTGVSFIIGLILLSIFKKNIYDKNLPVPFKIKPVDFSRKAIVIFVTYYLITYLFTGNAPFVRFVYRVIKNPSVFPKILTDDSFIILPVVVLLSLLFFVIYSPVKKRLSSHR